MKIIAFAGQLASGKDISADYLAKKLNENAVDSWHRSAFASAVKQVFMDAFEKDKDFIELWKRKDEHPEGMLMSVRKALQFIGDGFRQIKPSIWIDIALRDTGKQLILSDARYINEAKVIREKGGINIILYREGYLNNDPNPSESQIKPLVQYCLSQQKDGPIIQNSSGPFGLELYDFFLINNGTILDLYDKIDKLVVPFVKYKYGVS